jgi:hypothetical protein
MYFVAKPNTDAFNFLDAAGITRTDNNSAIIKGIADLTTDLKNYGIWNKMKAVYPFVGGTSGSCKYNLINPQDTDAAFRLQFNGTWSFDNTGATPNGSNAYANTFLNLRNTLPDTNNQSISFYSRTISGSAGTYYSMGALDTSNSNTSMLIRWTYLTDINSNYTNISEQWTGSAPGFTDTSTHGFYLGSRNSANNIKSYRNGLKTVDGSDTPNATAPNYPIFISARNYGGTPNFFDYKQCAFASIGAGLSETEAINFYTAVQRFQTTLGRQV